MFSRNPDYRRRVNLHRLLNYYGCAKKCRLGLIAFESQLMAVQHTFGIIDWALPDPSYFFFLQNKQTLKTFTNYKQVNEYSRSDPTMNTYFLFY